MSPEPRPTSIPSGILIHPVVWPQKSSTENWGAAVWPQKTSAEKCGAAVPLLGGSWVPIKHNVALAETYLCTNWHLDPSSRLATIDMGQKVGAVVPLSGGERESYLLIHPAVWPQ